MRRRGIIAWLVRGVIALLLVVLAAYPADWAVWHLRGAPKGQVQVSYMTSAALKGNKTSYFYDGSQLTDCSYSLFPEAGAGACWWVSRHPIVVDQY